MNKERIAGLIFEGEITDEQIKQIPKRFRGDIVVNGDINCDGPCEIPGNLLLNGDMKADSIRVSGDMYTFAERSYVMATKGGINVSGDLILRESCDLYAPKDINVGGDLEGTGQLYSANINVYQTFRFKGEISLDDGIIHAEKLELDAKISDCGGIKSG